MLFFARKLIVCCLQQNQMVDVGKGVKFAGLSHLNTELRGLDKHETCLVLCLLTADQSCQACDSESIIPGQNHSASKLVI